MSEQRIVIITWATVSSGFRAANDLSASTGVSADRLHSFHRQQRACLISMGSQEPDAPVQAGNGEMTDAQLAQKEARAAAKKAEKEAKKQKAAEKAKKQEAEKAAQEANKTGKKAQEKAAKQVRAVHGRARQAALHRQCCCLTAAAQKVAAHACFAPPSRLNDGLDIDVRTRLVHACA